MEMYAKANNKSHGGHVEVGYGYRGRYGSTSKHRPAYTRLRCGSLCNLLVAFVGLLWVQPKPFSSIIAPKIEQPHPLN